MKQTGKALLDFIKELLPNLVASGLWDCLKPPAVAVSSTFHRLATTVGAPAKKNPNGNDITLSP